MSLPDCGKNARILPILPGEATLKLQRDPHKQPGRQQGESSQDGTAIHFFQSFQAEHRHPLVWRELSPHPPQLHQVHDAGDEADRQLLESSPRRFFFVTWRAAIGAKALEENPLVSCGVER